LKKQKLAATLRRLASEPTYGAYAAAANALEAVAPEESGLPLLRVAILRNFTLDTMIPVIKGEIALAGNYPVIYLGDHDSIARDALVPDSALFAFQPDFVIMAQWLDNLVPTLVARFLSLTSGQVNDEVERLLTITEEMVVSLRRHSKAPILVNNFPLPAYTTLGILDAQSENYQTHTILRINLELLRRLRQWPDVYLVDYMDLIARVGSAQGLDDRYWQIGQAPIGHRAVLSLGREYGKFFRALQGKMRKCLVLDCDNILWGGVVGEDGLSRIQLGTTYPGSCYRAFQQEILNLHDRGVVLALCSKNNEADVLEVFRDHPDMVLRETHFATRQVNWGDKVTNLTRVAKDLNIGLDSLVFVDDSQFECDLVREQLPQVAVLQLSDDPSTFRAKLSAGAYFDALIFSAEDRERNRMYRDDAQRKQLFESGSSLSEYLAKLEMVACIGIPDELTIPRVSQLTQKTNQFNLTTRRYGEAEIRALLQNPEAAVFYLKLSDRSGNLGIVGVAIVKYFEKVAEIDTLLLSCRVIGRGAEDALLAHILTSARARGGASVRGQYLLNKKNVQVADFYRQRGFRLVAESAVGSKWEVSLDQEVYRAPDWIKVNLTCQEVGFAS
jgi:FkbH-like protein